MDYQEAYEKTFDQLFFATRSLNAKERKEDEALIALDDLRAIINDFIVQVDKIQGERKKEWENRIETLKKVDAERIALLEGELNSIKTQNKKQKINGIAKEFVSQKFVEDDVVREAITEKFANRLDVRDERLIVLDIEGNPTGLDLKDLQNEFLNTDAPARHTLS